MKSALDSALDECAARRFGTLTLVWAESGRLYNAADLAFAEELAATRRRRGG